MNDFSNMQSNPELLKKLVDYRMPYGKYQGRFLLDLPEPYVVWFYQKGLPKGELGQLLGLLYEIKLNGLESILTPLRNQRSR